MNTVEPPIEVDPLFNDVVKYVIETGRVSATYIQRRFNLGYARSARLLDQLEENGIVGPFNGAKPREILTKNTSGLDKETLKKNIEKTKRKQQIEEIKKWIYRLTKISLLVGLLYFLSTLLGFELTVFIGMAFIIENIISKQSIWD